MTILALRVGLAYPQGCLRLLWRRWKVTVSKSGKVDLNMEQTKLRNVGIMAHIDAGKTTTTERFLYYSGVIPTPGEVHHGDTVTDFLPQERERGITIQSAVVSFNWKNHKITLIDTPGHVDFTFEVQRSLRVVDSAVAILDASAGVEAQTLTVWRQAADYRLPRLIYLNKMDKKTASVDMCIHSILSKLKCRPILLHQPFYDPRTAKLVGIIDVVEMRRLVFDRDTKGARIIPADVSSDKEVLRLRAELVEQVADLDTELAERVIEMESLSAVTNKEVYSALRRLTLSNAAVPVLLGSSYKNIGVQSLMDAILLYFPHPGDWSVVSDPVVAAYGQELCAFAFKTMHDQQIGPLTFLRIFSGKLGNSQKLYNVSRGKQEKIGKVYLPLAEELTEATMEVGAGEVVIVSGLKETITGDTLSASHSVSAAVARKLRKKDGDIREAKPVLTGVHVPEPVFMCSIEPASISQQKLLEEALDCLLKEDPSLHFYTDPDSNQMILSGMGELHMDIIHQRLQTEFKVDADLGKIQVAYKETIANPVTKRTIFERKLGDRNHFVCMELEITPVHNGNPEIKVYKGRDKDKCENLAVVTEPQLRHIQNGIESAMRFGPKLSFPVVGLEVMLHWLEVGRGTSDTILEAAAATCLRECLKEAHIYLMEPIVLLEITVDETYQKVVHDDLNRRRFMLQSIDTRHGNKLITGTAPLSQLMGYSTILRTLSSGLGTFSMQFSHNELVSSPTEEQKIIFSVRGF